MLRLRALLTTIARLRAGERAQQPFGVDVPMATRAAREVVFEVGVCGRRSARRARRPLAARGARPRFVWRITPVALITPRE